MDLCSSVYHSSPCYVSIIPQPAAPQTLRKLTSYHEKLYDVKLPYYKKKITATKKAALRFKGGKFMSTKFKTFLKDTSIRAVKTMAQTALSLFTIGQAITDISWTSLISISLVSGLYSVLTSIVNYNIRLDSPDSPDTTE